MDVTVEITHRGAEVCKSPDVMKLVRRDLLVRPFNPQQAFPQAFPVFAETPTKVIVPLHWARTALGHLPWVDKRAAPAHVDLEFVGELKPELRQDDAVAAVQAAWGTTGGAMLCLSTGYGKTTVSLYLACSARCKTLVLVHKEFLATQWEERIRQFVPKATVSRVKGEECDTSGDFVIAMIQTLVSRKYPASTFASCGVVVADECFPYRQQILTEHGPMYIGQIYAAWRAGREVRVQSFDESTRTFELKRVTHAWEKQANGLVKVSYSKSNFKSTPNHLILTTEGWKQAGTLQPDDLLVSYDGGRVPSTLPVRSVEQVTLEDKRVYDLEVEGTHTFVCTSAGGSGPVVHNCHHVAAQAFSSAMWGLCAPLTLGLTATPQRKDRLDKVVTWFMGGIAFHVRRENQDGTVVKVRTYSTPRYREPPPVNRRGDMCFTSIITELANDAARTALVADEAQALAGERDVLVLSHRRAHCTAIAEALAARGVDASTYLGGDKTVPGTRVVVSTYALTSEGFDCPRLTALVLATPASDVEQSCGRVMRGSASQSAIVVDVVDDWGVCYAQHAKRKALYKRCGFTVTSSRGARPPPPPQKQEFAFVDDAS